MSTSYVFFLNHTLPCVSFFTLDQTFQTASNGDSFKLAENLARERKSGIWGRK